MLKQKLQKYQIMHVKTLGAVIIFSAVLAGGTVYNGLTKADQFDDQINALKQQNAASQSASDQLAAQASSYQDAINKLNEQINVLQGAIVANQKASDDLQAKIDAEQADLEHQQKILAEDIKALYLEGQISTLEILASSHDLSDFVNRETDRVAVQNKIKTTVDQIKQLKIQLEQQQRELQSRIKDQQNQQAQLNSAESQQAQLLAYTEDQKTAYDQQIQSNNSQIASLRAQQAAANRALGGHAVPGDPGHGGYPARWDQPVPQDSEIDDWGMLNRECVSYTAWKVYQTYGYMPYWGGSGNANQWPGDAAAAGIPTGSIPRVHSVAISTSGFYGHAMWVEAVNGNMIYVSQYNYDLQGHYSEMWVNGSSFTYIYFGG
ncbi:MAG TPA: CHAP domain-containing protein [Candidatus Saccharimonadales bacterium]|nr:CHAP domain-containing protein [Candidatus Saccharimonadales bacterium]